MLRSTWDHVTSYQNRFHKSDLTHMDYYILQSMGACIIALHLRIEEEAAGAAYAGANFRTAWK